jgi:membrane dipeptidase
MTVDNIDERFDKLCETVPIVDTHNDFPYLLRVQLHNELHSDDDSFDFDSWLTAHTDLKKMKKGRLGIQFFSCFIECKDPDYLYTDFNKPNSAVRDTIEQIDVTKRLVDEYSKSLKFVKTADEALQNFLDTKGEQISITLGVEGLHQCDLSLACVRQFFALGVRYITLTHNCDNPFATAASSVAAGKPDKGLTDYGRDCIAEMNRLGMIVDLSHVSYKTMIDALEVTKAPVLFSHSSAYALRNHERNVRDDVLKLVKENGGVVCINFFPIFLTDKPMDETTIDDAVNHVKYIVDLIGWDHVGFGSDFDGIPQGPKGLEDVSKYPDLIKKVWKATDATEEQISKAMGLNVVRVWREAERVADSLKTKLPVESNWKQRTWKFYEYAREFPEIYPASYNAKNNIFSSDQALDNND